MDWNEWQRVLKWRALEEGDADGVLVIAERRREATAHTRAGLASEEIKGEVLDERSESFLDKRAEWLEREAVGWRGELIRVLELLRVPQGRWSWALVGWTLALITGYWLSDLGQSSEFNLLALPLVGLLAWNAVVIVLGVFCELMPASSWPGVAAGWRNFWRMASRAWAKPPRRAKAGWPVRCAPSLKNSRGRWPGGACRCACGCGCMWRRHCSPLAVRWRYMRAAGAREYRAVWESTLLDKGDATAFFETLFKPASKVLRTPIPLDQIAGMHRTLGKAGNPAPALTWIHLYAGTLLVLVVMPRLLLAGIGAARCCRTIAKPARALHWGNYLRTLLRAVEGGGERIQVLVHAIEPTATHREVWDRGVRERFGGMARAEYVRIPAGEEDEFAATWQPVCANLVMLFNMATTPEAEVQRRLVSDVRQRLLTKHAEPELIVLLDGTSLAGRWSPEKIAGREQLWAQMVEGLASEVIVAVRKESTRAKPPLS